MTGLKWAPRAWAKLAEDERPDAYRRYGRNFKRQLLDSFVQARHDEEGHRSLLETSTDFVRILCQDLKQELEQKNLKARHRSPA